MSKSKRLTGLNPLAYMGDESSTPPQLVLETRSPTVNDRRYYNIGTLWIVSAGMEVWMLVDLAGLSASWIQLYPSAAGTSSIFYLDTGAAIPTAGSINMFGDALTVATSGAGNTVTIGLMASTDGEVLIGSTGGSPVWGNITSTGGSVIITNGANSINLENATVGATSFVTDLGTAAPALNILNVLGGTNINTAGAGNTITINMDASFSIPGTITIPTLTRGVVQSDATGLLFSDEGTDGQVIISSSAGAPAWANITSTDGSVAISNGANSIDLTVSSPLGGSRVSFLAYQSSSVTTILGGSTTLILGEYAVMTEVFDNGGGFYGGDGAGNKALYTAPVAGKYFFSTWLHYTFNTWPANISRVDVRVVTTNHEFILKRDKYYYTSFLTDQAGFSILLDLNLGDTVYWRTNYDNGGTSSGMTLYGSAVATTLNTYISGFLAA